MFYLLHITQLRFLEKQSEKVIQLDEPICSYLTGQFDAVNVLNPKLTNINWD